MRLLLAISLLILSLVGTNGYSCSYNAPSSCNSSIPFVFEIINDLNESCQLFKVSFNGRFIPYDNMNVKGSVGMYAYANEYWILTSTSGKIRTFTSSEGQFKKSGVSVNISKIPYY